MALTQNQFNTVKNYLNKAMVLQIKANELVQFTANIVSRSDPASSLNQSVTLAGLLADFNTDYNNLKTQLQTAYADLP